MTDMRTSELRRGTLPCDLWISVEEQQFFMLLLIYFYAPILPLIEWNAD